MSDVIEFFKLILGYDNVFVNALVTIAILAVIVYACIIIAKKVSPIINKALTIINSNNKNNRINEEQAREIEEIKATLNELSCTMKDYIESSKEDTRAIMKSTLMQIYHDVHEKGYILECDSDTFIDVMERYERAGGNGKMHTVVQPYIEKMSLEHEFVSDAEAERYKQEHGCY